MEFEELIQTVKKIDISDKNSYIQKLSGLYNSKLKGDGLSFDSIRKYEPGDDVRDINWNVTARFCEPHINTFTEDKQRLVWLIIDISGSSVFGTSARSKMDLEIEVGAILAYNAIKNNDSVGIVFFSDKIEKLIQPCKGMQNFWLIAKTMVEMLPCGKSTDIGGALQLLMRINSKRSIIFILSDFVDDNYGNHLKIMAQKHKLIAIKVNDEKESSLPLIGWVKLRDSETGEEKWVNTNSVKFKRDFAKQFEDADELFKSCFTNNHLSSLKIATNDNVIEKLMNFVIF